MNTLLLCRELRLIIHAVSGKEYGAGVGTHKHIARGEAAGPALEALKLEVESEGVVGDKLD